MPLKIFPYQAVAILALSFLLWSNPAVSQEKFILSGRVTDNNDHVLPGATVTLFPLRKSTVTDSSGRYSFPKLNVGEYTIEVTFIGFQKFSEAFSLRENHIIDIHLNDRMQSLQEIIVADNYPLHRSREESLNVEVVNDDYLKQFLGGSLMQSLERLPGVSSIDIGAGQSKPVIRGLGFNRVVVVENGIKHEAQQWGADHGLEVDQFAFDRIEVIKGPSSLKYGSDAIGGVIDLKQVEIPQKRSLGGNIDLIGKTNNKLAGTSSFFSGRWEKLFFTFRGTILDYADYRIPVDTINIYSYRLPLYKNRLRNTAGQEKNLHFSLGYQSNGTIHRLFVSNVSTRQGFFANTHGLEPRRVDTGLHDLSDRDIHLPYQNVNHFKMISRSIIQKEEFRVQAELGYQHNNRREWSPYTRHGFMPPVIPAELNIPAELERQFIKSVYSTNLQAGFRINDATEINTGISLEYMDNDINGRGFIIPAFEQTNAGGFLMMKHRSTERILLQAGIRFDHGRLRTSRYADWYTTPVETAGSITDSLLQRAPDLSRNFSSTTWSAGMNYHANHLTFKLNAGKSFRMPAPQELAANGVNYHRFSYEKGNPDLSPETSYQLDASLEYHTRRFAIGITPFANYFPNYIYLNPGYEHDRLYGNGNQVFTYTESQVMRLGGELHSHYDIVPQLKAGLILNYIWSEQLSGSKKGFTLPFSPPASALFHLKFAPREIQLKPFPYVAADVKMVASQSRIVPPEEKTPGFIVINLSAGFEININQQPVRLTFQMQNLSNKIYFNHTSYYRLINVPEPGRNVILGVNIPF